MSKDYSQMLRQAKIEELMDQNNQLNKQIELLKGTNNSLVQALNENQSVVEEIYFLKEENMRLTTLYEDQKNRNDQLSQKHHRQMLSLKEEINYKENEIQMMAIQQQRQVLEMKQQLKNYKQKLKSKGQQIDNIQNQIHEMTIERYGNENSQITKSYIQDYPNRFSEPIENQNYMNKSNFTSRTTTKGNQDRVTELMKFSRDQIKIAIQTNMKTSKKLDEGVREASCLPLDRLSNVSRMNRTYMK